MPWWMSKDRRKAVVVVSFQDKSGGLEETTKAEYLERFPANARNKCWCCGQPWGSCLCEFYETAEKCPKCHRGLACCCVCLTYDGPLAKMFADLKDGKITEAEVMARIERGGEAAEFLKSRTAQMYPRSSGNDVATRKNVQPVTLVFPALPEEE